MQKIITLFQRNYDTDRLVRDEITPGAEWVAVGEGKATQKFDGTCCLVRGGRLFKRYEARLRFAKAADPEDGRVGVRDGKAEGFFYIGKLPDGFEAVTEIDSTTLKQQGWVPVSDADPADRWHREAMENHGWSATGPLPDGTYELCGPKVQGNPERLERHTLIPHGASVLFDFPRDFAGIRERLLAWDNVEGVVWHHPDGRMVKIKRRDFVRK